MSAPTEGETDDMERPTLKKTAPFILSAVVVSGCSSGMHLSGSGPYRGVHKEVRKERFWQCQEAWSAHEKACDNTLLNWHGGDRRSFCRAYAGSLVGSQYLPTANPSRENCWG
jgi:hypothetical protein